MAVAVGFAVFDCVEVCSVLAAWVCCVEFCCVMLSFGSFVLVRSVAFSSVVLCFVPLRWVKFRSGSYGGFSCVLFRYVALSFGSSVSV